MRRHPWSAAVIDCRRRPRTLLLTALAACAVSILLHGVGDITSSPAPDGVARLARTAAPLRLRQDLDFTRHDQRF